MGGRNKEAGMFMRALALRNRADQGTVYVIAFVSMLMTGILLQSTDKYLMLCIALVGMRVLFELRQPAN